jgi:rubrerythrin
MQVSFHSARHLGIHAEHETGWRFLSRQSDLRRLGESQAPISAFEFFNKFAELFKNLNTPGNEPFSAIDPSASLWTFATGLRSGTQLAFANRGSRHLFHIHRWRIHMKKPACMLALALLLITTAIAAKGQNSTTGNRTLENLQTAFNGESNAQERYLAFAVRADQEGYGGVASLFRAAARAEEIYAGSHLAQIKKLRGSDQVKLESPVVKSTKENLEAAVRGETYERDIMYPEFYKQARAVGNNDAFRTFNYARNAEAEHAKLFMEAFNNLENMRGKNTYYVCTVCGSTTTNLDFAKCHICFSAKEKFVAVS